MDSKTVQVDEVLVTFRFIGDSLDPEEITAKMGITPTSAHAKGESVPKHADRRYSSGYWGLDSPLATSCSLDEHLRYLLQVLESKVEAVMEIKRSGLSPGFYSSFYCGYCSKVFVGSSVKLDADILRRIAALGARLEIQIYCDSDA